VKRHITILAVVVVAVGVAAVLLWPSFLRWRGAYTRTGVPSEGFTWAEPIQGPGLANFHRVSDRLYRGAQPTAEGMAHLNALGVRTIVNLRSAHSDRDEIGETPLGYEHITMKPWHPETKEVIRFLQIVTDPARQPIFVHCQRGSDRTGFMCAIYRMAVENWPRAEAIREMVTGGFGFEGAWKPLMRYLESADIEAMRRQAGVETVRTADAPTSASAPASAPNPPGPGNGPGR